MAKSGNNQEIVREDSWEQPTVVKKESRSEQLERRAALTATVAMSAAEVAHASRGILDQLTEMKRINADVKIAQEQAKIITRKMDQDFMRDMTVLNHTMDARDKIIDTEIEVLRDGLAKGDTQLTLAAMAAMNNALSISPADELAKLQCQKRIEDDPLLDW